MIANLVASRYPLFPQKKPHSRKMAKRSTTNSRTICKRMLGFQFENSKNRVCKALRMSVVIST